MISIDVNLNVDEWNWSMLISNLKSSKNLYYFATVYNELNRSYKIFTNCIEREKLLDNLCIDTLKVSLDGPMRRNKIRIAGSVDFDMSPNTTKGGSIRLQACAASTTEDHQEKSAIFNKEIGTCIANSTRCF